MKNQNFSTTLLVEQTPEEVFNAINNVRGWWSENIEGETDKPGIFYYHYQDIHRCTFKITELIPGKKVAWHVLQNYFSFVEEKTEWTGTDIIFEITRQGDKTEITFTHVGLVPEYECHAVCTDAWNTYINHSLFNLITKGKGDPTLKGQKDRSVQQTTLDNHPNA
ncbi:SRPBCC domain-containing protein [Aliifodinibius sp. S!AR15-10]|uniref:SRPBCC family protein n=1 Tax=Aliifodinibius sp. S!AR15-10 TaxID=2950437 RepID=UPI00285ACDC2|nr:SRPBCC domain-containing protein [Aliifodinibius sp. S!AR15-10]MDR8391653.1 SRPBCC domain-containing protein [Aliifodinibius sp. S!AR15-10]